MTKPDSQTDDQNEVDYLRFCQACAQIRAEGKTPTVRMVQKRLASMFDKGLRNDTACAFMKRWCSENPQSKAQGKRPPPPPEPMLGDLLADDPEAEEPLRQVAKILLGEFSRRAERESRERALVIAAARETADEEFARQGSVEAKALRLELRELGKEVTELREEEQSLNAQLAEQAAELDAARRQAAEAGQRQDQLAREIGNLQGDLAVALNRAAAAEKARDALYEEKTSVERQLAVANEAQAQSAILIETLRDNLRSERANYDRLNSLAAELATKTGAAGGDAVPSGKQRSPSAKRQASEKAETPPP